MLSLRVAADLRKFNAQNFYTAFASDTANEKVNSFWNQLNLNKKTAKGLLNFDVAIKKLRDRFWFNPSAVPNDNKTNQLISQFYFTSQLCKQTGITTGIQVHRKQITSNDRGNHSLWHSAVYSIIRHQFGNQLFLNESLRLDWDENYGLVLVP